MRTIIFISMLLFIISCDIAIIPDFWYNSNEKDFSEMSIIDIHEYEIKNIKYKKDIYNFKKEDYFQKPEEVERKRSGDCEDRAVWLLSIVYRDKGIKGNMVFVDTNGDGKSNHALTRINGNLIKFDDYNYNIILEVEFDDIPFYWSAGR